MGLEPVQTRHVNSFAKTRQRHTVHRLVEWGGGERGSKDNYKGGVNKVRK
jgi:hypothetical protein